MKKSFLPDYRRETMELIKKHDISISSIVQTIGVSQGTAYNWKIGKKSPSRSNFERLRALASGQNLAPAHAFPQQQTFEQRLSNEVFETIKTAPGRLDQLTRQVESLNLLVGSLIQKLEDSKKKPISRPSSSRPRVERRGTGARGHNKAAA